jgi:hypothetical protein
MDTYVDTYVDIWIDMIQREMEEKYYRMENG